MPEKPIIQLYSSYDVRPKLIDIIQPWLNPDKQILLFYKLNSFLIWSINKFNFLSASKDCSNM